MTSYIQRQSMPTVLAVYLGLHDSNVAARTHDGALHYEDVER